MKLYLILMCFGIICLSTQVKADGLIDVFKWKQIDYYNRGSNSMVPSGNENLLTANVPSSGINNLPANVRPKPQSNINDLGDVSYIPYNNVPIGATHYYGRLFVTVPRRSIGIPSTLNYIDLMKDGQEQSPKLKAYPDFETNQFVDNADGLVSVYRTTTDSCGRLWFIDTGMLEYPNNQIQIKRPSIWVMNLKTDSIIRRFEIPDTIVAEGRGLASLTVDTDKGCDRAFAYIPDLAYYALYVYSFENSHLWSFRHEFFNYDPSAGDFNVGGQLFSWDDGIFSTTLGAKNDDGSRNVLFHAMVSYNEYMVSNAILQNELNALRSDHGKDFCLMGNRGKDRQSTIHEYDPRTGVVFYAEVQRNAVGCWNSKKTFMPDNHGTVAQDGQRMIYPSDLTIDEEGILWVMTNSMPIFIYSTLDTDAYNFRVWKQNTTIAASNTKCA